MAWETRGSRSYYYRSRRIDGRVVKEYLGEGFVGAIADERHAQEREAKRLAEERDGASRMAREAADNLVAEMEAAAGTALKVALEGAGFHRHHRGEWRKHRG